MSEGNSALGKESKRYGTHVLIVRARFRFFSPLSFLHNSNDTMTCLRCGTRLSPYAGEGTFSWFIDNDEHVVRPRRFAPGIV